MRALGNIFLFVSLISIVACRSDKPEEVEPVTSISIQPSQGLFILNEGNFMWSNATIDYYKSEDKNLSSDLFNGVNKKALGDVLQSMTVYNGKTYLIINNSGKIEVVDPTSFQSIGTITGMKSPRYFIGVSANKAYVSDYKSHAISVIDLTTQSKVKEIPCSGWTEEMLLFGSKVFVTNVFKEYVYVLDTTTDKLTDSIKVGYGSGSIVLDKDSKVWVLSAGDAQSKKAALTKINPVNNSIEFALTFTDFSDSPGKLKINGAKDVLYYLNNGVYKTSINASQLPSAAFISDNSNLFYGLGVDPISGDIYVADAIDYVQKGKVYRYNSNASLISSFDVGLIPNGFYFY